jgi:coenzyme F420-reducing hydrogenase delta subunit
VSSLASISLDRRQRRFFEGYKDMEVVVYACQQAVADPEALRSLWGKDQARLRLMSEPCSSKVEVFQMLRTLAGPTDLVWVIGCVEELCRYQEGSRRMAGRLTYTRRYLKEIGLEEARVGRTVVTPGDLEELSAAVAEIKARAQELGPSPLRRLGVASPSAPANP